MNGVAAFWAARNGRERILIGVAAALALLLLLVTLVIRPLQSARARALSDIRTYETLNARIRADGLSTVRRREGAPEALLASSAAEFGLGVRPVAGGGLVRVLIADASFDALIRWIAEVERSTHLRLATIRIERRDMPGRVSAAMSFRP